MDALFGHVERLHGDRPWGRMLDAGTGSHSLTWMAGLVPASWTAVTADEVMRSRLLREVRARPGRDEVLVGNWTDPTLLQGQVFDVVIADYLLGAVDGFAPYFQDQLFERLRPHTRTALYMVGWEPLVKAEDAGTRFLLDLYRFRDACMLLGEVRPYREYPLAWVVRSLQRSGFNVVDTKHFPILHTMRSVERQLLNAERQFASMPDPALVAALKTRMNSLKERGQELLRDGPLKLGSDYVVAAEPVG